MRGTDRNDRSYNVKKIITGSCAGVENTLRETVENGLYKIVVADMSGCQDDNIDDELGVMKVTENEFGQIIVQQRGKKVITDGQDFAASIIMASGAQLHIENQGVINRHIIELLTGI